MAWPVRAVRSAVLLAALALSLVMSAGAQAQVATKACSGGFRCGTLKVALDRGSALPGSVGLHFAVQSGSTPKPLLIALSGGPGQPSLAARDAFEVSLAPLLERYRLAVLDQRGTGRSGALRCDNVQALRSLDAFRPASLAACARKVGARRAFYTTADTVLDLDELRAALGADKVALMGISYGTHVALQYARAFPARVDRLVLDSIVGPDGPDGLLLDTYRNLPRVLAEQCSRSACSGITRDPVADVAALVGRLNAHDGLRGAYYDEQGRRRTTAYATSDELAFLLIAGDLNAFLQPALPAAFAAARRGDRSLLMRLRRTAQGPNVGVSELSFALNVATGCDDMTGPFTIATPLAQRPPIAAAAAVALTPADRGPFDAATVLRSSYADDCLQWPADVVRVPFTGPLPDVPALLLGGRTDLRTPLENAEATARLLPRASVVSLRGQGHDTVDGDTTGCVAAALGRFAANRAVGSPCSGRDNGVAPFPRPPRALSDFRAAPGIGGDRGRALFAILDTVDDARVSVLQSLFSGLPARGGGLNGGSYDGDRGDGLVLRGYAYLKGLRVSGSLSVGDATELRGTVRVSGRMTGELRLDGRGGAAGTLGGRAVSYRRSGSARAARVASRRVDGASMPTLMGADLRHRPLSR